MHSGKTDHTDMQNDTETLVRQIYADIQVIKNNLENDYKAIHGNGKPGLLADVSELQKELAVIKAKQSWWGSAIAGWVSVIAWLITTAVSIIALIVKVK